MKISELIPEKNVLLDLSATNKEAIIQTLADKLMTNGYLKDVAGFTEDIWQREHAVSTEVGYGIAMPHAKSAHVKQPAVIFARSLEGIVYDHDRCHLFFMIAAQEDASDEHLETLSRLSTYLMDELFRAKLILAQSIEEVIQIINQKEQEDETEQAVEKEVIHSSEGFLVGVTACTAGIAHTYMSAQALKDAAHRRGLTMKVQTDGSSGTENRLTDEEIKRADGVIVAVDRTVDMSRFAGKKVVETSTKKGINNADQLIEEVLNKTERYQGTGNNIEKTTNDSKKSGAFDIYKHLMNGVSFMLPFVVSGGILIALSFMFGINSANPDSSQYNEFAAFLNSVGGSAAFGLMVPIFAGYVAFSIADRPGLAPGAIGGMIAATGGSGFLGGLIAGFVAGYSVLLLKNVLVKLPKSLHGLNPVLLFPVLGTLITTMIIHYVINTPISTFNDTLVKWLTDMNGSNAVLVGALLGGILVSDMGGPLNKIAYAFGIQMITAGVYGPMAALMCGGMIPPIGLGLATTFFRNKFTKQDRETGKVAYVLGSCFITEGVIPFAAADPLRVIPANIIGAAVGGALSMAFGIQLTAPHGGIFVIPIAVNKPILYIGCILAGSIVTALIVGVTKKAVVSEPEIEIGGEENVSDFEGAI